MLTIYQDPGETELKQRFTFGRQVDAQTWQTGFIYVKPGYMGAGGYNHQVVQLAFFIDVRRPSGEVIRLWQSRQGANYSWEDAFTLPRSVKYIAYGGIGYANEGSEIFDAKRSCQ